MACQYIVFRFCPLTYAQLRTYIQLEDRFWPLPVLCDPSFPRHLLDIPQTWLRRQRDRDATSPQARGVFMIKSNRFAVGLVVLAVLVSLAAVACGDNADPASNQESTDVASARPTLSPPRPTSKPSPEPQPSQQQRYSRLNELGAGDGMPLDHHPPDRRQ